MSPRTSSALEQLARPLRWRALLVGGVAVVAASAAVLAVGAWALRLGLARPPVLVVGAWAVLAATGVALLLRGWRERVRLGIRPLALALESAGTARRGALVALLDRRADGTSPDLLDLADQVGAADLAAQGAAGLRPLADRFRQRGLVLAIVAILAGAALAAARPTRGEANLLWRPGEALGLLVAPVTLTADPAVVDRGAAVRLDLGAVGHRSATLWRRAPGQPWTSITVALDSSGRAVHMADPVDSDLYFRLTAGSRGSDTVHVQVRLPPFLGALTVRAIYPAYLDLESEPLRVEGDTLLLPAGTALVTEGEASRHLATARWVHGTASAPLAVEGRRFNGRFVPGSGGAWALDLATADGATLPGEAASFHLLLVPDSTPVIELPVPGADTVTALDLRIPLVVDVRDDHGLRRVEVVSRSERGPPVVEELPLPSGAPDRALLAYTLDLSDRALQPGDTVRFFARAFDHHPSGHSARTRDHLVIVPSEADRRAAQRADTREAQQSLDSLLAATRRLERQTEDLTRQQARQASPQAGADRGMSFDEARQAEAAARNQEELIREAEELQETLEALEEAVRRGEAGDSVLARRLAEVSEQLRKALSPELREKLAELQRALQELDPEATRQALRDLAALQRELREALERSRELFRRAALEGELSTLAQDAGDLAEAQAEWNREIDSADSARAAAVEQQLAERADSLASALDQVARQLDQEAAREGTAQAAEQARDGAGEMQAAASAAQQGQRQQARRRGEQAQSAMEEVQRRTEAERERQQDDWRQEVIEALDRALAETARLSRQQLAVSTTYRRGATAQVRGEQAAVEESVARLIAQLTELAGQNALVSPQIAVALTVARRQMAAAREAISTGSPNLREASERAGESVDALNVAAFGLVRSRDDVAGSSSGSGLAEAMERMTQLAQQQGQLSQQAGGLLPMGGMPTFDERLRQLALDQRGMARELERLRAEGQLPGAGDMSAEARELARRLESGRLDPETIARQERLFRRMLDAGRTLQGEEEDEDKERQAEAVRTTEIRLPPALRQRLGEAAIRFPTWEELQQLTPEERRLVTEYFRRLAGGEAR